MGRLTQGLVRQRAVASFNIKAQAGQVTDDVPLNGHRAIASHACEHFTPMGKAAQQGRSPPVDETLHQLFVQRIRQSVLDLATPALPVLGVRQPVATVGGVGERSDACEPLRQPVDLSVHPV